MRTLKITFWMLVFLTLGGCASTLSGETYSRDDARREMNVRTGVVESVREVLLEGTKSGVGTVAGAVVGGVGGSHLGGGSGQIVGGVIGAVLGGMAGSAIEESTTKKNALEISVRLDGGQLIAVVQETGNALFRPGDRVRVLSGNGSTRVAH